MSSQISPSEDIRSVTELKRNTRGILDHLHNSERPVILTINGRANSVLLNVQQYERLIKAANMASLLAAAEADVDNGKTRPVRSFIKGFKHAKKIPG
jgi:PHD/YefM family antitoxin component YafN of YafNO toxin-antitoxin module